MRSLQQHQGAFEARRVRLIAISVDPVPITRDHCAKHGYTFLFLSDPAAEVIRRYDLLHQGGKLGTVDISRPAEFLIDSGGTVRWRQLTDNYRVRVSAEELLGVIDALDPALAAARRPAAARPGPA